MCSDVLTLVFVSEFRLDSSSFVFVSWCLALSLSLSVSLSLPLLRFRKRYAREYEGMSTAELSRDLRRDVEHYRDLWRTGRQADTKVSRRAEWSPAFDGWQ